MFDNYLKTGMQKGISQKNSRVFDKPSAIPHRDPPKFGNVRGWVDNQVRSSDRPGSNKKNRVDVNVPGTFFAIDQAEKAQLRDGGMKITNGITRVMHSA